MTRDELERRVPVTERHLCEEHYLARFWLSETFPDGWADFLIYPVVAWGDVPMYQRKDAIISPDPVASPENAEVLVGGFIKWDGCCEFEMLDMAHFCGPESVARFAKMLCELHGIAADVLEAYER